jgi:uncharacterized protein YdeI (YjbR/CyaY-like superfamily)
MPNARQPVSRTLKRPIQPMPDVIRDALVERDLMGAFEARPPYQRNDYLGWIARARRPATQQKRLDTMLRELATGSGYMGLPYDATSSRGAS